MAKIVAVKKSATGIVGELVRVFTEDGLELNGVYCGRDQRSETRTQKSEVRSRKSDVRGPESRVCLVHVHGWDGNFYENRFIDSAASVCSRLGVGFISGNNRGHDYIADILRNRTDQKPETRNRSAESADRSLATKALRHEAAGARTDQKSETRYQSAELADRSFTTKVPRHEEGGARTNQKPETRNQKAALAGAERRESRVRSQEPNPGLDYVQLGGVYEVIGDCVPDIRAWIDFAVSRGAKRVILQGHSHGAIKVAHYLVTTSDPRVSGLVLLSPSDDMGIAHRDLGKRDLARVLDNAHALVHCGMGRQVLPVKDLKYPVSAATFYDCHNKDSLTGMFNMSRTDRSEFPELAAIRVPVLMAVGTVEEAFVGAPGKYVADVQESLANCPAFTGAVIEGAPHNYLGRERELGAVLEKWLVKRVEA